MTVRSILLFVLLSAGHVSVAQHPLKDIEIDTTVIDYDVFFSEFGAFIDSLTAPRTTFMFNNGLSIGAISQPIDEYSIVSTKKFLITPSLSYFHRSGFGISGEATLMDDGGKLNAYQYSVAGAYDYIKNRRLMAGVSYTHFFTKQNLSFYTSPLQSQLFAYFTYRKFWLKPTVAVSYAWGNRSDFQDREEKIIALQLAQRGFTRVNTSEKISDLNLTTSLKHDFYWLKVFNKNDHFRFTPQLSFSSGTHQFGFNQTSNTYATVTGTGTRILYNSENINLDNNLYFQPLALSSFLKAEYSYKKFFINPQLIFDYYFPAVQNNFTMGWLVNVGCIF